MMTTCYDYQYYDYSEQLIILENNNHNSISSTAPQLSSSSSSSYDTSNYNNEPQPDLNLQHRPIFSKNAEGELFLLATNFLLYVALVIVVILVCRIYFPELLIARNNHNIDNHNKSSSSSSPSTTDSSSSPSPSGNYKYRVADPLLQTSSKTDDNNDDDDDDEMNYGTDDDDDDDMDDPDAALYQNDNDPRHSSQKFSLEFQQESLSRKQVLQRLIFCCIMLNVTFVLWGALQVRWIIIFWIYVHFEKVGSFKKWKM